MKRIILGIESSCDDTSVALVKNMQVIDCITISSAHIQNKFGGVMPEVAAREHEKQFIPIMQAILEKNKFTWDDISHIAYTLTPGLKSSLLVGQIFAQTLSLLFKKKILPINHVYGHIFSPGITNSLKFPHLSLVVSGKTTAIYLVKSYRKIVLLDQTSDNAIGEVYDKVARLMGLEYPGGPIIDKLFDEKLDVIPLLKNKISPTKTFSYSGILSAASRYWENIKISDINNKKVYMATVFQKWVIESLVDKIKYWLIEKNINFLTVSGGVAANKYLHKKLSKLSEEVVFVDKKYAGDNAAMIAFYAEHLISEFL